ncbi:S1C family serine protease [Cyanobium sp. CH-040]|uniref:S1C family serine protease n=1 Tax=Cyanobium sp. CH-040 TaxID=2823708 RepID=UPI0020CF20F5|nr:trypsin-like peptidase domain-containing protein [Cyanobium sp. CH-040]MCP9928825.1 trypsin-like peptidase domain-containing protein [Cyanobium sp. CH-040]
MTTRSLASLAATGLVALALNGCLIVAGDSRAPAEEPSGWRQPASQPARPEAPAASPGTEPAACSGSTRSAQEIFAASRGSIAVVHTPDSQGSAFVVSHGGGRTLLLTNSHVVGPYSQVQLRWSDGSSDQAAVVADAGGSDPSTDLALLEVSGSRGTPLALASGLPEVGQNVFAIGAPKGLEFSLSRGVVSQLRADGDLVQTDAAINGGNSGGPLLDELGCVVGMATFILRDSQGLNFALSSQLINPFLAASSSARTPAPASPPSGYGIGSGPEAASSRCVFQSYKTPQAEEIGCSVSTRRNSNGHTVYDVAWADGYRSSYVFWRDGDVEILSKGGAGQPDTHLGTFEPFRDGVAITSNEGSVTVLPNLEPSLN